jgi:hypothetical protein
MIEKDKGGKCGGSKMIQMCGTDFSSLAKNMLRPIARPRRRPGIERWNRNSRRRR